MLLTELVSIVRLFVPWSRFRGLQNTVPVYSIEKFPVCLLRTLENLLSCVRDGRAYEIEDSRVYETCISARYLCLMKDDSRLDTAHEACKQIQHGASASALRRQFRGGSGSRFDGEPTAFKEYWPRGMVSLGYRKR